ncbi:MAG: GH1 family beta-glucosidase [Rhodanobacteraceae bacterium]
MPAEAAATSEPIFPAGFLWGCATSAYQVEGSPLADGAGPSNWHRFAHTPGCVRDGDTGDIACDHYRRWRDDVALMRALGLRAYRFSIAWSRVMPEGRGRINAEGLAFYDRLVDALLENGIQPMVTLYHWDLPAALDDRGGWLNPDSPGWFADYAQAVFRKLDDRVGLWATLNEPWVVTDGGYVHGVLAPGHRSRYEPVIAAHHLLKAHGAAVQAYRSEGRNNIGIVVNLEPKYPATQDPDDLAATARADAYMNRQFLDPICLGLDPEEMKEVFGDAWCERSGDDLTQIRQAIDFIGVNYYTRSVVRRDPRAWPQCASGVPQKRATRTATGWEVYPQGLADVLNWVSSRYGRPPIYITENGAAFYDPPTVEGGRVKDPLRAAYLRSHLLAARAAMRQGVDLRGYFVWSLLDNFEWAQGYARRFGIVHVDFATQQRTPKASAKFYADVIATHGAALLQR